MFEGPAILRKMQKYGLIGEEEKELDFVLQLSTGKVQAIQKLKSRRKRKKVARREHSAAGAF